MNDYKICKHKEEALKKWQQQNVYKQVNGKYIICKSNDKRLKFTQSAIRTKMKARQQHYQPTTVTLQNFIYFRPFTPVSCMFQSRKNVY